MEGELFGPLHFPDLSEATKVPAEHLAAVEEEFDELFTGQQATETGRKNCLKKGQAGRVWDGTEKCDEVAG